MRRDKARVCSLSMGANDSGIDSVQSVEDGTLR